MEDGNWQSWAAPAVVILTALAFLWRHLRLRKKSAKTGCGHGCGCPSTHADKFKRPG